MEFLILLRRYLKCTMNFMRCIVIQCMWAYGTEKYIIGLEHASDSWCWGWVGKYFGLKRILSCREIFWSVKTDILLTPNHYLIFQLTPLTPLKSPQKTLLFLVRNSTKMALTAPLFPLVETCLLETDWATDGHCHIYLNLFEHVNSSITDTAKCQKEKKKYMKREAT